MTSMTLSPDTQQAISNAIALGPGENNLNYWVAYNAVASDLASHRNFNSGTLYWFSQAGAVNRQLFSPSAAGTYIWNYTMAAAQSEGTTLSNSDLQAMSNKVATTVFNQLINNNFVLSDNPDDETNFYPNSIIRDDAGAGLSEALVLHPG
jgi:hypothetical protein